MAEPVEGISEEDDMQRAEFSHETKEEVITVSSEKQAGISEAESENHNETVNASGMTLRDDTALLVTVTEYVSPTYNQVYEEYEYDSENRIIKLTEYLHGEVKHEYGYEYRVIGVEES